MEIQEQEDGERRWELWKLLYNLKTTVEGLLSTNNPNVWSRYGGLQRLHKDMNNILGHGLKHEQIYYKQKDYWRFVWCVRYLCPHLARHVEQFSQLEPVLSSSVQSFGEGYKAERWLLHSLQAHVLSAQLKPLLQHKMNTQKYYNDGAFLLSEPHVSAMFQCLEAVEQNNPRMLALIDTVRLSHLKESPLGLMKSQSLCLLPGAPGHCRPADASQSHRLTTSQSCLTEISNSPQSKSSSDVAPSSSAQGRGNQVAGISFTEPVLPESRDFGDGDLDDGPEYLAIGNLGKQKRRDSSSSVHSSEHMGTRGDAHTPLAPPPQRRCSFSEAQKATGRSSRGHIRSLSDTGVTQKQKNESVAATACSKSCGPFSPQSSDSSANSSLYMESNGSQYTSVPDGLFRRPSEGQSLISYLSEQDFGSCADLEKENAHFSISESLIAAIELMKCNMRRPAEEAEEEGDSDSEIQQLKQKIRLRRLQIRRTRLKPAAAASSNQVQSVDSGGSQRSSQDSFHPSDSGSDREVEDIELRDGSDGQSLLAVSQSGLSLSLASLFSDADIKRSASSSRSFLSSESISPSMLQSNSAESVAMGLLRQFEGMQLPAASELDWLVPEHDAPQKLLPIPDSLPISPDDGEHADIYKLRIRVRGNLEWAPPRPQIIFNIHPPPKRKVVIAKQNYRCAGCGIRIEQDYMKRLRYCEYLGRYFCQCCHENAQSVIPAKIIRKWDFSKSYVSNFSRDLLAKISGDPLFNLSDINSALYKKVKALDTVRALREQLNLMKNLLKTCRLAKDVLEEFDSLLPGHLTEDMQLFSLSDLNAVRSGSLTPQLRHLLRLGSTHVTHCMLCQAKGFICEFCGNDKDIIFPYELNKCLRCEDCHACYHKSCFKTGTQCPRCLRLTERRERMARRNMEEQEDEACGT
ncbi:run domain Beclin-1-interacting and cysteine-rich domain-containing protein isoform X2 [Danio rerio]|uniref:Rubicon autophagy regulator n=1 Tax=Danio rerio TaxID=7955 RepID=F1Q4W5_DANRE|nr:run domain Beclin-1-interacting and cysteine-rich domain-containing protein isoform X2 [Danio rerio]|eukprot:XP_002666415.3 run domain Beclin-1-interacting and cysteine-rich domain-containing protein isoform X2 [Danio rerio]